MATTRKKKINQASNYGWQVLGIIRLLHWLLFLPLFTLFIHGRCQVLLKDNGIFLCSLSALEACCMVFILISVSDLRDLYTCSENFCRLLQTFFKDPNCMEKTYHVWTIRQRLEQNIWLAYCETTLFLYQITSQKKKFNHNKNEFKTLIPLHNG